MSTLFVVVVITVIIALIFDVINGFHDAANSIATIVSQPAFSVRGRQCMGRLLQFRGHVYLYAARRRHHEQTGQRTPHEDAFVYVVLAGILGALVWDLLTWLWGLPTSSSHALVGGVTGAGFAYGGLDVLHWEKIVYIVGFIPLAPLAGFWHRFFVDAGGVLGAAQLAALRRRHCIPTLPIFFGCGLLAGSRW